jgi:peptidoglycan-N-acetylglucosamine deacetylase
MNTKPIPLALLLLFSFPFFESHGQTPKFKWPDGKKMALSLSFDDARSSNVENGFPLFDEYGVKATFFIVPSAVEKNLEAWKEAVKNGHEMGNHTVEHPCSGNFVWARHKALENYTLGKMEKELLEANNWIEENLDAKVTVLAYPCGQPYIGAGIHQESYVPLVAKHFLAGRNWLNEAPVDPFYADLGLLNGMEMDNKTFEDLLPHITAASENAQWLVLAGHDIGEEGRQTTSTRMLRQLIEYAQNEENGIWIAPMGEVADYVQKTRRSMADTVNIPTLVRPGANGRFLLTAENGRGVGPRIEYMPDWKAFGWFTGKDHVEWEVDAPTFGRYSVVLEWSVSDEEAGKSFVFENQDRRIEGEVMPSGSWETFKSKTIGEMYLRKGYNKLIFKPKEDFGSEGALLDLKEIILQPIR